MDGYFMLYLEVKKKKNTTRIRFKNKQIEAKKERN
jgi:hypothetical protein